MPPSMRKQARLAKQRNERDREEQLKREKAVDVLNSGSNVATAVRKSGISRATCDRIKKANDGKNTSELAKLLNPAQNRAGKRTVLSSEEESMIKDRLKYAAERGFAYDANMLANVMREIASDGRKSYSTASGTPSKEAIRSFRARHRDITYRCAENKHTAKLRAENLDHVATFTRALQNVEKDHPTIFNNSDKLWNLDETEICADTGRKIKVFGSSSTHHGGSRAQHGRAGRHVTAVMCCSASGKICPPTFIISGVNIMRSWFEPLSCEQIQGNNSLKWLCRRDWFPREALVLTSKNGSMEKHLLRIVIEHVNSYVRKFIPDHEAYCLLIDGHSSRVGLEWLQYGKKRGCEIVQSPSNTSHFLQACDARVNKQFKRYIREMRDEFSRHVSIDLGSIQVRLMLGIAAMAQLSQDCIQKSWEDCGLWPVDFRYEKRFQKDRKKLDQLNEKLNNAQAESVAGRLQSVMRRKTDADVWSVIKDVVQKNSTPSKGIQEIQIALKQHKSVNDILMSSSKPHRIEKNKSKARLSTETLHNGTPAIYLTHGDLLKKREEEKRELEIENEKKRLARIAKKEEAERKRAARAEQKREREMKKIARAREHEQAKTLNPKRKRKLDQVQVHREVKKSRPGVTEAERDAAYALTSLNSSI